MSSGLLIAAVLMGVVGVPHCLIMCGVPCSMTANACASGRRSQRDVAAALQLGRMAGYAMVGALAASMVSFAHLLAGHVTALRPLWVLAQVAILFLGLALLATGRMPDWLQTVHVPLHKLSSRLSVGRMGKLPELLRAAIVGACWAALPCAQLYAAVVLASMANDAIIGAAVMVAYAVPSGVVMWLGSQWLISLLGRQAPATLIPITSVVYVARDRQPRSLLKRKREVDRLADASWVVRLTGAILALSAGLMLAHSSNRLIQTFCS